MRSEFQFFMMPEDEEEFVRNALEWVDNIDRSSDIQWFFEVGDCSIQLLRCSSSGSELVAGRIAIATSDPGVDCSSGGNAEQVYKAMQKWLKKTYTNQLQCRNVHKDGSVMRVKNFWASPRVVQASSSNCSVVLRQIPGAPVIFELARSS